MVAIKFISASLLLALLTPTLQYSSAKGDPKRNIVAGGLNFPTLQSLVGAPSQVVSMTTGRLVQPQQAPLPPAQKKTVTEDDVTTYDSSEDEGEKAPKVTVTPTAAIVAPELLIGRPFPVITLDPAIQTEAFVPGLLPGLTGSDKGHRETSLAYLLRLSKLRQLGAACKKPRTVDPKILDRVNQGLEEGTTDLVNRTTQQATEWTRFLEQRRAATDAFLRQQQAVTDAFLTQRRRDLQATTETVATVIQVVHKIPGAEKCLSDSRIQDELARLKAIQRAKEEELAAQTSIAQTLLEQLQNESLRTFRKEEAEAGAEIDVIRLLREELHATHPAPLTIPPLSPRKAFPSITDRK